MKIEIVGVWIANAPIDSALQEEEVVAFRLDGTGWIEQRSRETHRVELFRWMPTSAGWYVLTSTRRFERDPRNLKRYTATQREPEGPWEHLPISVEEVQTPRGLVRQLAMELPDGDARAYTLVTQDADSWPVPQTPT